MKKNTSFSLQFCPARTDDAKKLARVLRAQDRAELAASHPGQNPADCLERFVAVSSVSVAISDAQELLALAGVYHPYVHAPYALVWLLTGEKVTHKPIAFFKLARFLLQEWMSYYGDLFNYIDARYTSALAFAERLGGNLELDGTYFNGQLFLKCTFRRNQWEEL